LSISQTKIGSDEKILNQNDPAPYYGVLVPESRYRYYVEEVDRLNYELAHQPDFVTRSDDFGMWFAGGAILGFIVGIFAK
jgi:hypothetical protein